MKESDAVVYTNENNPIIDSILVYNSKNKKTKDNSYAGFYYCPYIPKVFKNYIEEEIKSFTMKDESVKQAQECFSKLTQSDFEEHLKSSKEYINNSNKFKYTMYDFELYTELDPDVIWKFLEELGYAKFDSYINEWFPTVLAAKTVCNVRNNGEFYWTQEVLDTVIEMHQARPYNILDSSNCKIVVATSYEPLSNYIHLIEQDLIQMKYSGQVVFDLTLTLGLNNYFSTKFNCIKFDPLNFSKIDEELDFEKRKVINQFWYNNKHLISVDTSILNKAQVFLFKKQIQREYDKFNSEWFTKSDLILEVKVDSAVFHYVLIDMGLLVYNNKTDEFDPTFASKSYTKMIEGTLHWSKEVLTELYKRTR